MCLAILITLLLDVVLISQGEIPFICQSPLGVKGLTNMHLHTVLYKLPKVLTRRICLIIKSFFSW